MQEFNRGFYAGDWCFADKQQKRRPTVINQRDSNAFDDNIITFLITAPFSRDFRGDGSK